MDTNLKHPTPAAGRQAAPRRLLHQRGPRLSLYRLAVERAEHRLYEELKDDPTPPAELISPFVEDIVRLRREEQDLRDRLGRRWRLRRYR
jgi:hypothetical protein